LNAVLIVSKRKGDNGCGSHGLPLTFCMPAWFKRFSAVRQKNESQSGQAVSEALLEGQRQTGMTNARA
jgi:hypothetical protein